MTTFSNSKYDNIFLKCDKTPKLKMWGEKTQKLKLWYNSKTQIVRKIKTQKLKSRPNLNQIATQLKTSSRDKTQGLNFLQLKNY